MYSPHSNVSIGMGLCGQIKAKSIKQQKSINGREMGLAVPTTQYPEEEG